MFVPEGNILIGRAAACWALDFGSRGCAAKCKVIGALSHNPAKGPLRVSWNAAYIGVSPTRVCGLRVFHSELRLNSGEVLAWLELSVLWEPPQKSKFYLVSLSTLR